MRSVHPAYTSLMEEEPQPEVFVSQTRLLPAPQIPPSAYQQAPERMYREPERRKSLLENKMVVVFLLLAALSGGTVFNKASEFASRIKISYADAQVAQTAPPTGKEDIEIIKRILTGLVPAVEELKREVEAAKAGIAASTATDLDAAFPYNRPVKVISEKAYIREMPNKDAKTLMTMAKDTVLFAETRSGDWIEVALPVGGKGFIHKSTVQDDVAIGPQENKIAEVDANAKAKTAA